MEFFREDHIGFDDTVYAVSELTGHIRELLESSFPGVWVEGEISNFKLHSSGHMYFSLKDSDAMIACVLWKGRSSGLIFKLKDGLRVKIFGKITVFEKYGKYQLDVMQVVPVGEGSLQQAFFELKQKLFEEGLFDEEAKKEIPKYPETIGVVTSPTGAAVRDIINVISRRYPCVNIIIAPVRVQGVGAAREIVDAIDSLNHLGCIDVMIVGRGGGSLEDLWAFNEEIVAQAVYNSEVPVVSAVGHEVDFTICDFTADMRAPTPSAAAELVVPDRDALFMQIHSFQESMSGIIYQNIQESKNKIKSISSSYIFRSIENRVKQTIQYVDTLEEKLTSLMMWNLERERLSLEKVSENLEALNPEAILKRGYSITMFKKDGRVVHTGTQLKQGDRIRTKFYKGSAESTVDFVDKED